MYEEQELLDMMVDITAKYLEDEDTTPESCMALGRYTREALDTLGLSKKFSLQIADRVLGDLKRSIAEDYDDA